MNRIPWLSVPDRIAAPLLALVLASAPATAGERLDRSVVGRWKLVSVLDFAEIAALDEIEAKQLVGKVLTVHNDEVRLDKTKCGRSSFRAQRVSRDHELRENAHVLGTTLGLPDPVDVIELSCAYLYLKNRHRAVLAWEGTYFDLVRLTR